MKETSGIKNFTVPYLKKEPIEGVIHFAASSLVGESVEKPLMYFNNNVYGMQILLEVMHEFNVKKNRFLLLQQLTENQRVSNHRRYTS